MAKKLSKVLELLKEFEMQRRKNGGNRHQKWGNATGRKVQLAPNGKEISELSLHILSGQLETQGVCSRRDFMRRLREI